MLQLLVVRRPTCCGAKAPLRTGTSAGERSTRSFASSRTRGEQPVDSAPLSTCRSSVAVEAFIRQVTPCSGAWSR